MDVLVVGGTGFLGSAIARMAVAKGDHVTVLSRRLAGELDMPDVEILTGDRNHDLSALKGRQFDAVFDTCGYTPDSIKCLLDMLEPFKGMYVFISSTSVYGDYSRPALHEQTNVPRATTEHIALAASLPAKDRAQASNYGKAYGPLKRECECVALQALGDQALILRSGLLVGAGDYTDRMTWWVRRIDEGGSIPVPGPAERPIQLIDVRDAAAFAYHGVNCHLHGIYNLTSRPTTMANLLDATIRMTGSDAYLIWIDKDNVAASGIEAWTEIPLWLPVRGEAFRHFFEIDVEKAFAAGLELRPVDTTIADILAWDRKRRDQPLKCGMSEAQEEVLLTSASS